MPSDKSKDEIPANDQQIAAGDVAKAEAEQVGSGYQYYLVPGANGGNGRSVKARSLSEAIAKAEKLDKDSEGSK